MTVLRATKLSGPQLHELGELFRSTIGAPAAQRFAVNAALALDIALRGQHQASRPLVSFVVRTYSRQLLPHPRNHDPYSLRHCLLSLIAQTNPNWEALIVRSDQTPMPGINQMLAELQDHRLRMVHVPHVPKFSIGGYEVTDSVIALARSSTWLVVTNGDNTYEPVFIDTLVAKVHADVVAFDFYSRYVHILDEVYLGSGCRRYFQEPHSALGTEWETREQTKRNFLLRPTYSVLSRRCKANLLERWHSDLGANAFNIARWSCENRRFDTIDGGPSAEQDGYVAWSVNYWGWMVEHARADPGGSGCLYHHNPNIDSCLAGGDNLVWFERMAKCVDRSWLLTRQLDPPPAFYKSERLPLGTARYQGRCAD